MINISWSQLKLQIAKGIPYNKATAINGDYVVWIDDGINLISYLSNSTDKDDYDDNYISGEHKAVLREEGTGLPKTKPRPVEGTTADSTIRFVLNDVNSLEQDSDNLWSISTGSGDGLYWTKLIFAPAFSYWIDGGMIELAGSLPGSWNGIKACAYLAYGTAYVHPFIRNRGIIRDNYSLSIEKPPKYVKYYDPNIYGEGSDEWNKMTNLFYHGQNDSANLQFTLSLYK